MSELPGGDNRPSRAGQQLAPTDLVKLIGTTLQLEVILEPPSHLPLPLPMQQAQFCKVVARPGAMADGSPSVLIVIPMPPLGGTYVAEVGLRSFLDAAALLEGRYGRPGGLAISPAEPPAFKYDGPLDKPGGGK